MTKHFQYTALPDFETGVASLRPWLPIVLSDTNEFSKTEGVRMLVDSGAEDTVINLEVAEAQNIDLSNAPQDYIYWGNTKLFGPAKEVNLMVEGFNKPIKVYAVFLKELTTAGILRQKDFFENYWVSFYRQKRNFTISDRSELLWSDYDFFTNLFKG